MKKLLSFVMVAMMSVAAFAEDVYVDPSFTNQLGKSFEFYAGPSGNLYKMIFTVKEISGSTPGKVELTSIDISGGGLLSNETWSAYLKVYNRNTRNLIGTYFISEFGKDCLKGNTDVKTITLDYENQGIRDISVGESVFQDCSKLTAIKQKSNTVEAKEATFGDVRTAAFLNCSLFRQNVRIADTVFAQAFAGSGIPKVIALSSSTLDYGALSYAKSITTLDVAGKIHQDAVKNASALVNVTWRGAKPMEGTDFSSAEKAPFYSVKDQLTVVSIAGNVPKHTFNGMSKLVGVLMDEDFGKSSAINNLEIRDYAFANCPSLILMHMGGKVDQRAFGSGESLSNKIMTVFWWGGDPWKDGGSAGRQTQGPMYAIRESIEYVTFKGPQCNVPDHICYEQTNLKSVDITNVVLEIGTNAFYKCKNLKTVTFPAEMASTETWWVNIKYGAFYGCESLEEIKNFPLGINKIGDYAFFQTYALKDFPLNTGHTHLESIGKAAFQGNGAETAIIPANVKEIGGELFGGYKAGPKNIYFLPANLTRAKVGGSFANMLFPKSADSFRAKVEKVALNVAQTAIPDSMFFNFKGLKGVYPSSVSGVVTENGLFPQLTMIGAFAFYYTLALEDHTKCRPLSGNIEELGESCFEWSAIDGSVYHLSKLTVFPKNAFFHTNLESFNLGNKDTEFAKNDLPKLERIEEGAFGECSKMTRIVMPYSLNYVAADAFKNTKNVTNVLWAAKNFTGETPLGGLTLTGIESVTIATTVEHIPANLMAGATKLDSVYMNAPYLYGQTDLTAETAPFAGTPLAKVVCGDAVRIIPNYLFAGCESLMAVEMPGVKKINEGAFQGAKLEYFELKDVTEIGPRAFHMASGHIIDSVLVEGKFVTDNEAIYKAFSDNNSSSYASRDKIKKVQGTCKNFYDLSHNDGWDNVAVNFEEKDSKYEIPEIYSNEGGEVKSDLSGACEGTIVVEAVPDEANGYSFLYWIDGNTDNPRTVDLEEYNIWLIQPTFYNDAKAWQFTLHVTPEGVGHVDAYDEFYNERSSARYMKDEEAIFRPVSENEWFIPSNKNYPTEDWIYDIAQDQGTVMWRGGEGEKENDISVRLQVMAGMMGGGDPEMEGGEGMMGEDQPEFPQELTAKFIPAPYDVDIRFSSNGGGTFSYTGDAKLGQKIEITATPYEGFEFKNWAFDKDNTNATTEFELKLEDLVQDNLAGEEIPVYNAESKTYEIYNSSAVYFIEVTGFFKNAAEGIDGVNEEIQARKILRNGQMYIIRGGHEYDATGTQVR